MSDWTIEFHPAAELDLLEGFHWYADRDTDAALAFRSSIMKARTLVLGAPMAWPMFHLGTRKYTVRHFPYKIIYRIFQTRIQIVAVAHDRRRPNFWVDRLDQKPG